MADRLTQLQDAVDQLAHQFVASLWFVHKHHDLQTLSATDKIHEEKKDTDLPDNEKLETYAEADFKAGQLELAQDLIRKEQLIEGLICLLPGVNNSEKDQEQMIRLLEQELQEAEARRQEALKEKDIVLAKLENVIRSIKRP